MWNPTDHFLETLWNWQRAKFPNQTVEGALEHLKTEIKELEADLGDPMEIADALLLLCFIANKQGFDPIDIMRKKFVINTKREWKETNKGYSSHQTIEDLWDLEEKYPPFVGGHR